MKEKLVVEIFKDKIKEHYNKTIRTGVQCNCKSINVFSEIKEYSDNNYINIYFKIKIINILKNVKEGK